MTMQVHRAWNSDRVKSAVGVAAFHALLGYALVTGLGIDVHSAVTDRLKVFDVAPEPPPPPLQEVVASVPKTKAPEGAASPPNLKAQPSPVVAPPPEIRLEVPPPIIAAPKAGLGNDNNAGASTVIVPGTGAGGIGDGTGSGGQGSGTGGGGGVAARARLLRGGFSDRDYPRGARRARAQGTVIVRFNVGADGRVSGCAITRSSGNADLDSTTCNLIERRYRYAPARDSQGRPVPDLMGWKQVWWIERGGRHLPPDEAREVEELAEASD